MPGSTAVYVDMLFLINFLMDFVVLWAAARLAQVRVSIWRLFCGALIGAIYSILVLLPNLQYMSSIEMKFIVSIIMAIAAYVPLSWKKFGQVVFYFYLVAFTIGGAVLGIIYMVGSSTLTGVFNNLPLSYLWLLIAVVAAAIMGKYGVAYFKNSVLQDLLKVPIIIRIQGKELKAIGLVDTGNQLVDPLTGSPVVIVEYGILKRYLPSELQEIIDNSGEVDLSKLTEITPEEGSGFSFRLIPFTTIGKSHGMLVGFRPDEIIVLTGNESLHKTNVVIGIYNRRLSPRGAYHALLHPDLIQVAAN
ncbi:MAG: sigma-E processing peptidase SpoIIGA [Syntrophaceticus sp.]|jgi:stage II sporulation protein GA (sporulation sigma-E factor processing peptidase)|nr:sigma-E processing peptidase SpoIIGA [Syntrophaceticus sp.]MDD3314182.1 sigma-E processing peptidase SpoIIGA [Syntrophaceticus sp.]MDD4359374.1 sigma-E processing peptidase SpoIIGA [Syntrophaceticus sp.]MDD4782462.1 sigma-E processing peptidase SpoIIGA [Syntrophaceticus sp.]HBG22953.1 sigma-E processing peptidase SpoIIGA [Peptococcaceae bacterium]